MITKESFNLTTPEGLAFAKEYAPFALAGPLGILAKLVFDAVFEPSSEVVAAQAQAAEAIIRAGAENGAEEIDITLGQEAGAHVSATFDGHPVKLSPGKSGTVKLTVKYR